VATIQPGVDSIMAERRALTALRDKLAKTP
jgi:hypothetical protein